MPELFHALLFYRPVDFQVLSANEGIDLESRTHAQKPQTSKADCSQKGIQEAAEIICPNGKTTLGKLSGFWV